MTAVFSDSYDDKEAEQVLTALYHKYFQRDVDPSGKSTYLPQLVRYGFYGLVWVAYHIISSDEMKKLAKKELNQLYLELLGREVDFNGIDSFSTRVQFFRHYGKAEAVDSIQELYEYKRRQLELAEADKEIEEKKGQFQKNPKDIDSGLELALHYENTGRWLSAIEIYTRLIQSLGRPAADLYLRRGQDQQHLEEWDNAIKDYTAAIETSEDAKTRSDALLSRARAYEHTGASAQAIADYRQITETDQIETNIFALAWHRIGLIQQSTNPQEAIESFSRAIDRKPKDLSLLADLYVARARLYHQTGSYSAAATDFSRFVARSKDRERFIQGTSSKIYFVQDGQKYHIPDPPTLNYLALKHKDRVRFLEKVSELELNAYPEGESITSVTFYPLIESAKDYAVYWIEDGKRRWIPNPQTAESFALDPSKVERKSDEEIRQYPVGEPVPSVLGRARLVQPKANGNYFLIEDKKRRRVPNVATLHVLGYKEEEAEELQPAELGDYPEGMLIPDLSGGGL